MSSGHFTTPLFMPVASPPTPAPSPIPSPSRIHFNSLPHDPANTSTRLTHLSPATRRQYLTALLSECTPSELLFISTTIAPLLKRDFIRELPPEVALHIMSFIDDPKTLSRASQVSRRWHELLLDDSVWKRMCCVFDFDTPSSQTAALEIEDEPLEEMEQFATLPLDPALEWATARLRREQPTHRPPEPPPFSYRLHFKRSYSTMMNWRHGGRLLRSHRVPVATPDGGVVTSVALDAERVIVGLANSRIHVFSASTGVLSRTLVGHELGVWAVNLVSRGGYWGGPEVKDPGNAHSSSGLPPSWRAALGISEYGGEQSMNGDWVADVPGKQSDVCGASEGWGQPAALVVSGGCDKVLRVWDAKSGYCIYVLTGHTSTIRCVRVLHNRPVAVTGSRDTTLRVWDIQYGRLLHVLHGHQMSVRCLDVCGNRVVSGSYDSTCRLWDVDTGACLHVLSGHYHQIYAVAFDGVRIASGGLDTTVRVWDAESGNCLALLQGHTALVCQVQLADGFLATGGADGRVLTFALAGLAVQHRLAAHDSSVTALQAGRRFVVTGGNDGRVRLFEAGTGAYVRELSTPSEGVWKVVWRADVCAVMCRRAGKSVVEIWSFRDSE